MQTCISGYTAVRIFTTTGRRISRDRARICTLVPRGLSPKQLSRSPNRTRIINSFSSSPSSSQPSNNKPRLSEGNIRDLLLLTTGAFGAFGYYLIYRDNDWEKDVVTIQNKLIASSGDQNNSDAHANSVGGLSFADVNTFSNTPPPAVLKYAEKVLKNPVLPSRPSTLAPEKDCSDAIIVTAKQSGEYFAGYQWYRFDATLMARASTKAPGFVWDARTTIFNLSNHVLEYYITHNKDRAGNYNDSPGESHKSTIESNIVTKVWGKYPLIQIEEEDPYILFWLAMTPLFPTVFLQHMQDPNGEKAALLRWNSNRNLFSTSSAETFMDNQIYASAKLRSDIDGVDTELLVEFFFREDDLLRKIKVTSPSQNHEPWQAIYDSYTHCVVVDTDNDDEVGIDQKPRVMFVPMSIEIGKGEGDSYRPHFKASTHHLSYK